MTRIARIIEFLNEYDTKTQALQYLIQDIAGDYRREIDAYRLSQTTNADGCSA